MLKHRFASYVFAVALAFANFDPALALPVAAPHAGASAPALQLELVRRGGGGFRGGGMRGGFAHRGGVVHRGGVGVANRGYGVRGAGMRGGVARGAYRVGGRYYGGRWYGTGRRWYGGRWWAYGVGSCWRSSPIGYVWVCG
jgi:hypothetical protein